MMMRSMARSMMVSNRPPVEAICMICCMNITDPSEQLEEPLKCSHVFCKPCLVEYIEGLINERKVKDSELCCPQHDCRKPIHNNIYFRILPSALQDKLSRFQFEMIESSEEILVTCPKDGKSVSMPNDNHFQSI